MSSFLYYTVTYRDYDTIFDESFNTLDEAKDSISDWIAENEEFNSATLYRVTQEKVDLDT